MKNKKFKSIKTKLIVNTTLITSAIFIAVLAGISFLIIQNINDNIEKSRTNIRNALIAKGNTLASNNAIAMQGMVEDNSFTGVQALVSSTVKYDDDIEYGIFMDENRMAWVNASSKIPSGQVLSSNSLTDETVPLSGWAGDLKKTEYKIFTHDNTELIEFAAPVKVEEEILGVIRYGFNTESMRKAFKESLENSRMIRNKIILILVSIGFFSLIAMYLTVMRLATAITRPIDSLVASSNAISKGHYDIRISAESNDEIGNLAKHFENMRVTIKQYTDHLQDLVDEKMQQVNDILNNIDQGLFTINLDGSVNKEYSSRANNILKVRDVASASLKELFRMDPKQEKSFNMWMNLIRKKHDKQRWKKLSRLAPVRELELPGTENIPHYISIEYQVMYNKNGDLSKIMILALDETEKRIKERQMEEQRINHESEMKIILGLVNTPVSELCEFMEDTAERMKQAEKNIQECLTLSKIHQKENKQDNFTIPEEKINILYRDIHTIKGNSGSYGFELLARHAHNAENRLEDLRKKDITLTSSIIEDVLEYLGLMSRAIDEIREKISLIYGKDDDAWMRISKSHVKRIVDICSAIDRTTQTPIIQRLMDNCIALSWVPIETITRKYQKIVNRVARNSRKNIRFIAKPEHAIYPPDILFDIDAALVHLVRNAADHGIEMPEIREESGKGIGQISFEFFNEEKKRIIKISDNGKGIDTEKLVEKCVEKGFIAEDRISGLNKTEKMKLIFLPSVSTSDKISDTSGRGMGMDIVQGKIHDIEGTIFVKSEPENGTVFTLVLPPYSGLNRIHPISGFYSIFDDLREIAQYTARDCSMSLFGKETEIANPWNIKEDILKQPHLNCEHLVSLETMNREFRGIILVGINSEHIQGFMDISPDNEIEIAIDALGEFANIFCGMLMDIPRFRDSFGILKASPPVCHAGEIIFPPMWGVSGSLSAGIHQMHIAIAITYRSHKEASSYL